MSVLQLIIATTKAAAVILLQAKNVFQTPAENCVKKKQQEFVFHLLFFHIIVETGDIQISLKGSSDDPNEIFISYM